MILVNFYMKGFSNAHSFKKWRPYIPVSSNQKAQVDTYYSVIYRRKAKLHFILVFDTRRQLTSALREIKPTLENPQAVELAPLNVHQAVGGLAAFLESTLTLEWDFHFSTWKQTSQNNKRATFWSKNHISGV